MNEMVGRAWILRKNNWVGSGLWATRSQSTYGVLVRQPEASDLDAWGCFHGDEGDGNMGGMRVFSLISQVDEDGE